MSQYNKTVLTRAGLELAKRANAGQAKFGITRAVTSADDWSHKTVQDLEEVTTIPNIMQQGTITDTDEVESNNSVISVSLCFTNKKLSTGYQIRVIGLYVKEEGQENDFLYAVTTAVTPEYMPDFNDKVLYRFNMQMYLVIGNAQSVNVVINDGTAVTHGQLDKYKVEVAGNLKKLENTHKEDMSHVAKSASINGGAEILPDSTGKLNLVVPDPDLSKYVSIEQLTETLKTKADITAVPDKNATEEGIKQAKEIAQEADTKAQSALDNKADKTTVEENLATKANQSDLDQTNAEIAKKANSADVYTKTEVDSKTSGTIVTAYDIASKTPTKRTDRYNNKWLVDQQVLGQFADQINQLKGRQTANAPDFNTLTDTGVYLISYPQGGKNPPPSVCTGTLAVFNGNGTKYTQIYFADNGTDVFVRTYGWINGAPNWGNWNQIAWKSDFTNLQNAVNSKADKSQVNVEGSLFRLLSAGNTWNDILGFDNGDAPALVAFRCNSGGPMNNLLGNFSAGVAFGGGDTKGFLEISYGDHNARIGGGNGNAPVWHEDIAWKSDVNDLRNQVQQLRDNQFEVQTFTDANAAANWEAQKPGKRMAIVNS